MDDVTVSRKWTMTAKWRGLLCASVVAWFGSAFIFLVWPHIESMLFATIIGRDYNFDMHPETIKSWINVTVFVGYPIALIVVLSVGFPIWKHAEKNGAFSAKSAMLNGFKAGAIILLIEFTTMMLLAFANSGSGSSFTSSYGYRLSVNSFPTALGWVLSMPDAVLTVLLAGFVGLIARWAAGSPTVFSEELAR